jgi:O-antigen/teichoic acid export membrane protein
MPELSAAPSGHRSRRRAAQVSLLAGNVQVLTLIVSGLLLVPLYISKLGTNLYGVWLATGDVLAWFGLFDMGVAGIMGQRIAVEHGGGRHRAAAEYFGTGLALQGVLAACLLVLALAVAPFVPELLRASDADAARLAGAFRLAAFGAAGGIVLAGVSQFLLAMQHAGPPAAAVVLSQVAALVATVWLLFAGAGIWALAAAPLIRSVVGLLIAVPYAIGVVVKDARLRPTVSRRAAADYFGLFRPVLVGMVGNLAAGRSDAVIIAMMSRPEVVVVYVVTRRVAELISLVLSRIGGAVFAPFAHLVGSGEHGKAYGILGAITKLYWAAGVVMVTAYMALNEAFIGLWLGAEFFGGVGLTVSLGMSILAVGYASLLSYLLGAAGELARNGYYIFGEAVVRVVLMIGLFATTGLVGLPIGATMSSLLLAAAAYLSIRAKLDPGGAHSRPVMLWFAIGLLVAGAAGFAQLGVELDWLGLTLVAALIVAVASACMIAALRRYDEFSASGLVPILPRFLAQRTPG